VVKYNRRKVTKWLAERRTNYKQKRNRQPWPSSRSSFSASVSWPWFSCRCPYWMRW